METKKVLVTGVGGNVGQGIIRNIQSLSYEIRIIGTNVTSVCSGNYLCDAYYEVPFAYEADYISTMIDIVNKEKIDLIIPATDYEVYYLAENIETIPCKIAVSGIDAAKIYLDKYESWLHHDKHNIPFGKSIKPSDYENQFKECIVKPKKGRGSRGINVNPKDFDRFSDEEYMVQELHKGDEVTTAFYVTRQRKLHGLISLSRNLENGVTTSCKVVTKYDAMIVPILEKMIKHSPLLGSVNLQSIVTADNKVIPFEINCRISGTNSIRSNFGFKDVQYTLQEFLYNEQPDAPKITNGVAFRTLLDIIYPDATDYTDVKNKLSEHFIF